MKRRPTLYMTPKGWTVAEPISVGDSVTYSTGRTFRGHAETASGVVSYVAATWVRVRANGRAVSVPRAALLTRKAAS